MTDPRLDQFTKDAQNVLQYLRSEFARLQTGRASAALVEHIDVDAYGQRMDMKSVATISVQDARSIVIQPWDKSVLAAIEKAIQLSNIGVNPVNDGVVIRLTLPSMTEERRKELAKIVGKLGEEAKISIRQHRQAVHDALKEEKDEDVKRTLQDTLQKSVDKANDDIEELRKKKEEEIMKV